LKGKYDHNVTLPIKGKILKTFTYSKNRRIDKHIIKECVNPIAHLEDRTTVSISTLCIEMNHVSGSSENMKILKNIKNSPDENLDS